MIRCSRRSGIGVALLALVLVASWGAATADGAARVDPTALAWWGPETPGHGFHLRVPVSLSNPHDYSVEGSAAIVEVDIAAALVEAGWVAQPRGGIDLLRSFDLDEGSVRVVAMTNLDPMAPGTSNGLLAVHNRDYPPGDLRRHEVPSTHYRGSFNGTMRGAFDAETNPYITVVWRVPQEIGPGERRSYIIYFDSHTNSQYPHQARSYQGTHDGGRLASTFWSDAGTDLYGYVNETTGASVVTVTGLHDGTEVTVFTSNLDEPLRQQDDAPSHNNPFTISRGETRQLLVGSAGERLVRLQATRAILAAGDSEGHVPAANGGLLGDEFFFTSTYDAPFQDSVFIYNRHPDAATTRVLIQALRGTDWQDHQTILLNDAANLFPYTVGPRAAAPDAGCGFPSDGRSVVLPRDTQSFRAIVQDGGPVAVQWLPMRGLTQVPAVHGAPWGVEFRTPINQVAADPARCGDLQQYEMYGAARAAAGLVLHSEEAPPPGHVSPACSSTPCPAHAIGPVPEGAFARQTFTGTQDIPERPVRVEVNGTAMIMVAPPPAAISTSSAPQRGPLGGDDVGRHFAGFGSLGGAPILVAPFADTSIQGVAQWARAGVADVHQALVRDQIETLSREGDHLVSYEFHATRPMIVLPRGANTGYFAAAPPVLESTVHAADFRGHLVRIEAPGGLDPITASTTPGVAVDYELTVTNLGRLAGNEPLHDTVEIAVDRLPPGWTVDLSRTAVPLTTGERATITLTVTPPDGAEPGDIGSILVSASSRANGDVSHQVATVTHIKRSFDVGVWFDCVECQKVKALGGAVGRPLNYTLVVQNVGTVPDLVTLATSAADPGWAVELSLAGNPVTAIDLAPQEVATLDLQVTPPPGVADGLLQTTVTAQSATSSAALDRVFAISRIQTPSELTLVVNGTAQWVTPGEEAVFRLALGNAGGTTESTLTVRGDARAGWSSSAPFVVQPGTTERAFVDRISVLGGETIPLAVGVTPPINATAGDTQVTRVQAIASGQGSGPEVFLVTTVLPRHAINVTPEGRMYQTPPGVATRIDLRATNEGNLDQVLRAVAGALPPGWHLGFSASEMFLPRNGTQPFYVTVEVPSSAADGPYTVTALLKGSKGGVTEVPISVAVGRFAPVHFGLDAVEPGQPGEVTWLSIWARNGGNTETAVTFPAQTAAGWTVVAPASPVLLRPGANESISLGIEVPGGAEDGAGTQVLAPRGQMVGGLPQPLDELLVAVDVGRPQPVIIDAVAADAPAGRLVSVHVANQGDRVARAVNVSLVAGDDVLSSAMLELLPPGQHRNVTLFFADVGGAGAGNVSVVITRQSAAEAPRADGTRLAWAEPGDAGTPGLSLWSLAVLMAVVAASRRSTATPNRTRNGQKSCKGVELR